MTATNGTAKARRKILADRARSNRSASNQLGKQAKVVTDDLRQIGATARNVVREKLAQFSDDVTGYCEEGQDKAHQLRRGVEQYFRERPLKSIVIATGVGLLLGRYWMRR